jgi:TRAP-type mannitol/chloroaromatic compound transport system substrate-binding protein
MGRFRSAVVPLVVAILALLAPAAAPGQPHVRWRMQSAVPSSLDVAGEGGVQFGTWLKAMSAGSLELKLQEPGAIVPPAEIFNAVSIGSVEAGWTTAAHHAGRIPAAALFSGVPFGPQAGEFLAWLKFGGGQALKDEIYGRHGVRGLPCFVLPAEASGWFRREVRAVADLSGLRMRTVGLEAKVLQKLGVSTQLLAPGSVFGALQRGVIDAAEGSAPSIDLRAGLHQVAKHYYIPGWHSQATVGELLVNVKQYESLWSEYRRMIEVACDASVAWTHAAGEARQVAALQKLVQDHGVRLRAWPGDVLARLRQAWDEVAREEAARDADFRRVYQSYTEFRARYAVWREHGRLP